VLLDHLDFDVSAQLGREKIAHQGTFHANPASAAAGIAALEILVQENLCERASQRAAEIRVALNRVFAEEGVPWAMESTADSISSPIRLGPVWIRRTSMRGPGRWTTSRRARPSTS